MHTYLRNRPAWAQLMIFGGLTFGLLLVISGVGVSILAHLNHMSIAQLSTIIKNNEFAKPENAGLLKGLLVVNDIGLFILPPLIFSYLADPHPLAFVGLRPPQRNNFLLIALITMIAGYFVVQLLGSLNETIVYLLPKSTQQWILNGEADANGQMKNILSMKSPADLLITIFLAGVLPAVGEELFFRGILQKLFIQIFKSPWPGIIFTGFLFSAFHMQFMGFIPRMALGIILGALYWYSGSIYSSMLGHFIFNSISVVLIYFGVADLDSKSVFSIGYLLAGLLSIIIVVFLIWYLRKKSTTSYALEYQSKEYSIFDETEEPD